MDAFHSFWSYPNAIRNNGKIGFPDFELLTAILSALSWKKHNGSITMVTDSSGAAFFHAMMLDGLWDTITTTLDRVETEIDPYFFWAAGKLYALRSMPTPCVMLDTDLIIWKEVTGLEDWDVIAAHPEGLYPDVYPDISTFTLKGDFKFPGNWDFTLEAANTAFLYLKNREFRDQYVDHAISFFKHLDTKDMNPVTAMCFAEQRVLPMCAREEKQKLAYLFNLQDAATQDLATHTWGYKVLLRTDPAEHHRFCMTCVRKIMQDYPEAKKFLTGPVLLPYLEEYQASITVLN